MSEKKVLIVDDAVFMRSMQKRIISGSEITRYMRRATVKRRLCCMKN